MNYLKMLPVVILALVLAACGDQDQSAEETMEETGQKAEQLAEDAQEGAEEAWEETKEGASEVKEEAADAMDDASESDTWQETKERAKEAWVATKEFSMDAWTEVREAFKGDMTAEEKEAFDDCVKRLQKVEGLTEDQAERGCWQMMEKGTTEDYYAEEPDDDQWASIKEGAGKAWDKTKETSKEAWEATKEGSKEAWAATKEYSQEAWAEVKESFKGDMTAEQKKAFDDCVARLQKEEGLTKDQAERGCWRMMEEMKDKESAEEDGT